MNYARLHNRQTRQSISQLMRIGKFFAENIPAKTENII